MLIGSIVALFLAAILFLGFFLLPSLATAQQITATTPPLTSEEQEQQNRLQNVIAATNQNLDEAEKQVGGVVYNPRWSEPVWVEPNSLSILFAYCLPGEFAESGQEILGGFELEVLESYEIALPQGFMAWMMVVGNEDRQDRLPAAVGVVCASDANNSGTQVLSPEEEQQINNIVQRFTQVTNIDQVINIINNVTTPQNGTTTTTTPGSNNNQAGGLGQQQKALDVSISGFKNPIGRGSHQSFTVTVTEEDTGRSVAGALVDPEVDYAGPHVEQDFDQGETQLTDSNGRATFGWRIGGNSYTGTFTIRAEAEKEGYTDGTRTVTFTVTTASGGSVPPPAEEEAAMSAAEAALAPQPQAEEPTQMAPPAEEEQQQPPPEEETPPPPPPEEEEPPQTETPPAEEEEPDDETDEGTETNESPSDDNGGTADSTEEEA